MKKLHYSVIALLLFTTIVIKAQQVSIVNIQITSFNITPESMLSATIMNNADNIAVETTSKLYGSDNQLLLTVKSSPFTLLKGLNTSFSGSRRAAAVEYTNNGQSNYLKTTRVLPSGNFRICVELKTSKTSEVEDEYCDEIESDFNNYLYLVSPSDKDSMEIKNPMLVWAHSEPFNVLAKGESFRMIVTEIKGNQTPEEAVNMNIPVMTKNNLLTHNLQYPYEARGLEEGKHYAWQVSKISNGTVVAQTEVWEFSIMKKHPVEYKFASLRTTLDADYYIAENDKIYFIMQDRYAAGKWDCKIYDENRKVFDLNAMHQEERASSTVAAISKGSKIKAIGNNRYEIDLAKLGTASGFYTLEIINENGELFLLKFLVEK